jgi:hypothetical protein
LHKVKATSRVKGGVAFTSNFWEDGNELEDSKDRRSVGGHGNQYVRLRDASLDRFARIGPARSTCAMSSRATISGTDVTHAIRKL